MAVDSQGETDRRLTTPCKIRATRVHSGDEGSSVLEFTVGLSMIVGVVLVVAQLAVYTYVSNVSIAAAYEGARAGANAGADDAAAVGRATEALRGGVGGYADQLVVRSSRSGNRLVVLIGGSIDPLIPIAGPLSVNARAEVFDEDEALR